MANLLARLRLTGLRARLLGIVLLAVVPMALLLGFYASAVNRVALDRARTDVQDGLAQDVRSLQDLVAGSQATLVTFGITHAIQAQDWVLTQGNCDRLRAVHPAYAAIAVADQTGLVRASSPAVNGTLNVSGDSMFKRAVASRTLVVAGYGAGPITGRPVIRVALPIYSSETQQLVAVEWISFEPAELGKRMTTPSGATSETLIDGNGIVVAAQPTGSSPVGKPLADEALSRVVLTMHKGESDVAGGDLSLQTYFAPVFGPQEGPLYLTIALSADRLFAAQRRTFALTLLSFGGVALLALIAAWLVGTYSIYRPALQLRQATARLADGDLTARARYAGADEEFGALRDGFNTMAETLETHVSELQHTRRQLAAFNAELEERVRRRTAELEASNKELEAFSYSVSHDLRSPLRAIDGFSLALLEDYWDKLDDAGRDDLKRVRDNATRMGELIDSLLRLSRLSRQEMAAEDVDLSALARASAAALEQLEPDRQVTFVIEPDVSGTGDPTLLRNVIDNLVNNAWKFTGRHQTATIHFGAESIDGETVYFVKDDGAGFDMAYAGKLFGAFQRVHGQAEFPGIGIGLATTARIIRRHGGRIWAEGEPEKGATFWFTLS